MAPQVPGALLATQGAWSEYNEVSDTRATVADAQELNSLIVSHNRISEIPMRLIERLPALTKISMCVCIRVYVPVYMCIHVLTWSLCSSHNVLEAIPDLSVLTGVTELRLSHNRIKKLPRSLAKLSAS